MGMNLKECELPRRKFLRLGAAGGALVVGSLVGCDGNRSTVGDEKSVKGATLQDTPMAAALESGTAGTAIRPFSVKVPKADLRDLRVRLANTRFPDKETVADQSQGVQLATLQSLVRRWLKDYDWRDCEARLNAHPGFLTEIDGLDFHFLHARSQHENALPIVICHGWPGSIVEQLKIIDPLINPTAHGGKAEDAFHVVVPSMPGYGYSGKPTAKGWGPDRIARAYVELMRRLGYEKFVAAGGDWGAVVVDLMALDAPEGLLGIHTNMANVWPSEIDTALATGKSVTGTFSAEEQAAIDQLGFFYKHVFYAYYMADRPQAQAGIADSPLGLLAHLLEHDTASLAMITRSVNGAREGLSPDDILDNATHFWLTNSGVSAGRLYAENKVPFFSRRGVTIPVAVSVFPDELYQAPESWSRQAYPNLIHYNRLPKGGHFAAWEQPRFYVDEIRTGLRSLRT
jgi:pimeloyl-ACP methyl ester carboxylesterase